MERRGESEFGQKFGNVADLRAEGFRGGVFGFVVTEKVVIFLERRAAAGGVGDDGVEIGQLESREIFARDCAGGFARAGVGGERAAAALVIWDDDLATVGGEHAD